MNDTESRRCRLKTQMLAISIALQWLSPRVARCFACSMVRSRALTRQQLTDELDTLKKEYRYLTYEKNHGSLAAEMVVGDSLEENTK
jgi:hypothetical protein